MRGQHPEPTQVFMIGHDVAVIIFQVLMQVEILSGERGDEREYLAGRRAAVRLPGTSSSCFGRVKVSAVDNGTRIAVNRSDSDGGGHFVTGARGRERRQSVPLDGP